MFPKTEMLYLPFKHWNLSTSFIASDAKDEDVKLKEGAAETTADEDEDGDDAEDDDEKEAEDKDNGEDDAVEDDDDDDEDEEQHPDNEDDKRRGEVAMATKIHRIIVASILPKLHKTLTKKVRANIPFFETQIISEQLMEFDFATSS